MRRLRFWVAGRLYALAVKIEPADAWKIVRLSRENAATGALGSCIYGPAHTREIVYDALRAVTVAVPLEDDDGNL